MVETKEDCRYFLFYLVLECRPAAPGKGNWRRLQDVVPLLHQYNWLPGPSHSLVPPCQGSDLAEQKTEFATLKHCKCMQQCVCNLMVGRHRPSCYEATFPLARCPAELLWADLHFQFTVTSSLSAVVELQLKPNSSWFGFTIQVFTYQHDRGHLLWIIYWKIECLFTVYRCSFDH